MCLRVGNKVNNVWAWWDFCGTFFGNMKKANQNNELRINREFLVCVMLGQSYSITNVFELRAV